MALQADDLRRAFEALDAEAEGEPGFMLALFRQFDLKLRWWTVSANRDPEIVRDLLHHPQILPGFNDSGAHITNMAFYDGNLRGLQIAQSEGLERVASQVKRLTSEPADFIGVHAGRLEIGARADIAVIDPDKLARYDSEANSRFIWREEYQHEQMVNRSGGRRVRWRRKSLHAGRLHRGRRPQDPGPGAAPSRLEPVKPPRRHRRGVAPSRSPPHACTLA